MNGRKTGIDDVLIYLKKRKLKLQDLIGIGGEDLPGTRALHVEKAWALMAHHGLKFTDLEKATGDCTA